MANLGKYEIHEQLGTGSMGTVYRARDTVLHRDVALKTIRTGSDIGPEMRERFYREARSCGRLRHPNIVTIYDLGEQDQTAYIAMELLEGADFRKVIEDRRVGSLPDKLELMIQICDALGHAHRHGVIHRDIKPSNVFLAGPTCVKVLDFGIARLPSSRLTVAGNVLGTPNYMAPEQILAKPCDGRTDLFSAGVVFFEFVTGQHPFRGSLIPQRIVESEPDSLFDYDSNLPVLLDRVFTRALAKQPDQRYATGTAFAADLRTVLDALRQNSSPTFSKITLPSEREVPEARATSATELNVAPMRAPASEDSAEWRYSEVLGIIPLFEEALEHNDASEARQQFDSLQRVTAGDERFKEAITGCRVRLERISPVSEPAIAKATSPRICAQCGTGNRVAARFCIQCGADLDEVDDQEAAALIPPAEADHKLTKLNPAVLQIGLETIFDRTGIQPRKELGIPYLDTEPLSKSPQAAPLAPAFTRRLVGWIQSHPRKASTDVAAITLIAVAALALYWFSQSRSGVDPSPVQTHLEHFVATARVNVTTVDVLESKAINSRKLYSVSEDTLVNVLEMPPVGEQGWVLVQATFNGTPHPKGFVKQDQLNKWEGKEAPSAFAICCRFEGVPSEDKDFDSRRFALGEFASQFSKTAEATTALKEKARLGLELAKRHQAQGTTGDPLRDELSKVRLEAQGLGESAKEMVEEIDRLMEAIPNPKSDLEFGAVVRRALRYLADDDIDNARRLANQVHKLRPRSPEDIDLNDRIQEIDNIDHGAHQKTPR